MRVLTSSRGQYTVVSSTPVPAAAARKGTVSGWHGQRQTEAERKRVRLKERTKERDVWKITRVGGRREATKKTLKGRTTRPCSLSIHINKSRERDRDRATAVKDGRGG